MQTCGICGTDVTMWTQGGAGDFTVTDPIVIGYESSGIIHSVGDGISHLKIGTERTQLKTCVDTKLECEKCKLLYANIEAGQKVAQLLQTNE